eukprot:gene5990-12072_t
MTTEIPFSLKQEFLNFSIQCELKKSITHEDDIDEIECLNLLRLATQKLSTLHKDVSHKRTYVVSSNPDELLEVQNELIRTKIASEADLKLTKLKLKNMMKAKKTDKEIYMQSETRLQEATKTVDLLSAHIERLMMFIKQDAISKQRFLDDYLTVKEDLKYLERVVSKQNEHIASKDRLIAKLLSNTKALEDQLHHMDEKYEDHHNQLSRIRKHQKEVVDKSKLEMEQLRTRFWMEHKKLLEEMPSSGTGRGTTSSGRNNSGRPSTSSGFRVNKQQMNSNNNINTNNNNNNYNTLRSSASPATKEFSSPNRMMITTLNIQTDDTMMMMNNNTVSPYSDNEYELGHEHEHQHNSNNKTNTSKTGKKTSGSNGGGVTDHLMISEFSNQETKEAKIARAMIKLRRKAGQSSMENWTLEKAKMLVENEGCFG